MLELGKVYGDYKCIAFLGKNKANQNIYKMQCTKCCREKIMKEYVVKQERGISHKSCGKGIKTQDKTFYSRWQAMRTWTTNSKYEGTKYYKEKGIESEQFEYFIDFYDAMYSSYKEHVEIYGEKNTSLERIDNSKSYSKENCKWVTLEEQKQNQDRIKLFKAISPNGTEFLCKNVSLFAREHHLNRASINDVLHGRSLHHKHWKFTYID